jgi:phosphoglycolate phosphatase
MPLIAAGSRRFDVDAVVFDKDGTLIDFDSLWGPRTVRWVEKLAAMAGQPDLARRSTPLLGFDPARQQVLPDGPLAIGSTADLYALAAAVLFRYGFGWHEGRPLAQRAAATTMAAPPQPPKSGRLATCRSVHRLRRAGLQLAVATNDDRALTEATFSTSG